MGKRVTVEPATFTLVDFDAAELEALVEGLLDQLALDGPLTLEVDERTPLGRAVVTSLDPLVLEVESGALQDARSLRSFSAVSSTNVLGRLLLRVRDRRDPAFGDPPADTDLTLPQAAAWDAYSVGRLVRLGHDRFDERQRRLYQFRTRHGFSDVADTAFAALWDGTDLTWADIERLSGDAAAAAA
jgi:hypothetical protein